MNIEDKVSEFADKEPSLMTGPESKMYSEALGIIHEQSLDMYYYAKRTFYFKVFACAVFFIFGYVAFNYHHRGKEIQALKESIESESIVHGLDSSKISSQETVILYQTLQIEELKLDAEKIYEQH